MKIPRPLFDRREVKVVVTGRKIVSMNTMKRMLSSCLEKIDELQATIDEYEEDDADLPTLLDEGYINDKDTP